MENISGFGLVVTLIASNTYPTGIILTEFADDSDPFDIPSIQVADSAMGLNGDLIGWTKANPVKITLGMIPTSPGEIALAILLQANRASKGRVPARDIITMTALYPNGDFVILNNGIITDGMPANSVASAGRLKSKPYQFSFEAQTGI